MKYVVYGYYSTSDVGFPGEYIDEFDNVTDADECVKEFEKIQGRIAWVEKERKGR